MIILGIDPGTAITGYGIVEAKGNKFYYLGHGCIFTDAKLPMEKEYKKYMRRFQNWLRFIGLTIWR